MWLCWNLKIQVQKSYKTIIKGIRPDVDNLCQVLKAIPWGSKLSDIMLSYLICDLIQS